MKTCKRFYEIESSLMKFTIIQNVVVLSWNGNDIIAYIVLRSLLSNNKLKEIIHSVFVEHSCVCYSFVVISSLPLDENGDINYQTLKRIPLIDEIANHYFLNKEYTIRKGYDKFIPPAIKISHEQQSNGSDNAIIANPALAYAKGADLIIPPNYPKTLTEAILNTEHSYSEHGIWYISNEKDVFESYKVIISKAKRILAGLQDNNIKPQSNVILQIEQVKDFVPTFWGCILGGIIPVNISIPNDYKKSNNILNKFIDIWTLLDHPPIICDSLHNEDINSALNGQCKILKRESLINNIEAQNIYKASPSDILFFQLTAGSTGTPKCICERHSSIIHHIIGSQIYNNYESSDISLNWLPMDHVVPLLTYHIKDMYLGCSQVQIPTSLVLENPLKWLDMIEKYKVTHTWSPNFGFNILNEALKINDKKKKWDLSSIKYFMNAGEQVTVPVTNTFIDLTSNFGVSNKNIQPAFGMAEVCTCMTYNNNYSKDSVFHISKSSLSSNLIFKKDPGEDTISFIDLGRPMPGVEIRITDSENKLLPEGFIGRFQIKGKVLTSGYYNNDKANKESFVGNGWFNTGDLGFIINGKLVLTGREKEMIIINGANYYCHDIEDQVNMLEEVKTTYVAACGVNLENKATEDLIIFFSSSNIYSIHHSIKKIKTTILQTIGILPKYIIPIEKDEFPKTTSGKIQRNFLKQKFIKGDFDNIIQNLYDKEIDDNHVYNYISTIEWKKAKICKERKDISTSIIFIEKNSMFKTTRNKLYNNMIFYTKDKYMEKLKEFCFNNIGTYNIIYEIPQIFHEDTFGEWLKEIHCFFALLQELKKYISNIVVVGYNLYSIDKYFGAKSFIPGYVKSCSTEFDLNCKIIDLSTKESAIDIIDIELSDQNKEIDIKYIDKERYVYALKTFPLCNNEFKEISLTNIIRKNETYIIIGGLGGVGKVLSLFLVNNYLSNIIIIGTKTKEELYTEEVDYIIKNNITYITFTSNLNELGCKIANIENSLNKKTKAIFNLAGFLKEEEFNDIDIEYAIMKITDLIHISQFIKMYSEKNSNISIVNFSSVHGLFGGHKTAIYSATKSYMQAFSNDMLNNGIKSYCILWSSWKRIGMSNKKEHTDNNIYSRFIELEANIALILLKIILQSNHYMTIVGVNRNAPIVSNLYRTESHLMECVYIHIPNGTKNSLDMLLEKFKQNNIVVHILSDNPNNSSIKTENNDYEKAILELATIVLGHDSIDITESLFDYGMDSIKALKLATRIESKFKVVFKTTELFQLQTIKNISDYILK